MMISVLDLSQPHRVQLSRKRGARLPPNTVKVDRSTPWGNPFKPQPARSLDDCAQLFRFMFAGCVALERDPTPKQQEDYLKWVREHIDELRGKNLACWCPLDRGCHADVLLQAANHTGHAKES